MITWKAGNVTPLCQEEWKGRKDGQIKTNPGYFLNPWDGAALGRGTREECPPPPPPPPHSGPQKSHGGRLWEQRQWKSFQTQSLSVPASSKQPDGWFQGLPIRKESTGLPEISVESFRVWPLITSCCFPADVTKPETSFSVPGKICSEIFPLLRKWPC